MTIHFPKITALCTSIFVFSLPLVCQVTPANWIGQVQCRLDDVDQTYSRHEIQTWMITGAAPTTGQGMPVYPATWSVSAQGALQRVQGAQVTTIQWTANVPPTQASIAIFVRASDNRLIIKPWHSQQRMDYALNGMKQIVVNGVAQQPTNFSKSVWEWQFPRIEDSPTNANVSGSTQSQAEAGDADLLHHYGGMPPVATCQWQFSQGGMAPTNSTTGSNSGNWNNGQSNQNPQGSMAGNTNYQNNGQSCESPSAVQQSFENMKANLQSQYSQLIQGTSDPTQVASLQSQEQRMISNLNAQEQHDVSAASQGCVQTGNGGNSSGNNQNSGTNPSGNNPYSGQNGSGQNTGNGQNYGNNQYPGNNTGSGSNPGGSQNSGNNSYPGNNQNNGSNQNSGNTQTSGNSGNSSMGSSTQNGSTGSNNQTPTPQLVSITPSSVGQGATAQITLAGQGTHWTSATNVSFGPQVTLQSFTANPGGTSAVATINVAANASVGTRPVMLMSGTEMVGLPSGLTVTPTSSQQGSSGNNSMPARINTGSGFASSTVVLAGMLTGVSPAANNGQQNLTVTVTGERTNFAKGATTVSFARASQPGSTAVALPANAYIAGLNHTSSSPPVQVGPVNVSSATSATVPLTIDTAAGAGTYNITVTTPTANGTETVTLSNAFTVTAALSLSGVTVTPIGGTLKTVSASTPAPASGNYRVTMTGLMCLHAITGGGDAVYGAAVIRRYDRRSGQSTMFPNENTSVYGDTNGYIGQRIQAGTRGPMGGVWAGDFVPTGFIVGPRDTLPPQANIFPMSVWQGTLTDGIDALVISPSLWIQYGDNSMFSNWNQNEGSLTNSILLDSHVQNQINNQIFGALVFGSSENVSGSSASALAGDATVAAVETTVQAAGLTFGIPLGIFTAGPSHDRPIGVGPASKNDPTSTTILPNSTLVLTREIIEKRLGTSAWVTVSFNFIDDPSVFSILPGADRPGQYVMFLQIERQ